MKDGYGPPLSQICMLVVFRSHGIVFSHRMLASGIQFALALWIIQQRTYHNQLSRWPLDYQMHPGDRETRGHWERQTECVVRSVDFLSPVGRH